MTSNPNLEMLQMTHAVLSASLEGQGTLKTLIDSAMDTGIIPVTVEFAAAIQSIMAVQSKMISGLTEQNQQIAENVEAVVNRLSRRYLRSAGFAQ